MPAEPDTQMLDPPVRSAGQLPAGTAWRWLRWAATDADGQPDPLPLETWPDIPAADDP